jgi:hypothetical protein
VDRALVMNKSCIRFGQIELGLGTVVGKYKKEGGQEDALSR